MDPEGVRTAAADAARLASAVHDMHTYATGDDLAAADFGDVDGGAEAWQAFSAAAGRLADSVAQAQTVLGDLADRMTRSAAATTATDEDAARTINAAGQGA